MKKILYTLAFASILFTSCKKEETAAEETTTATDTTTTATDSIVSDPAAAQIQPVQPDANGGNPNTIMRQMVPNPAAQQQTGTTQMASQQTAAPVKVGKGMNPSHGQPGHRCDIAVGAPLNSPAGKSTVTKQQQVTPQQVSAQQNTVPNSPMMFNTNGSATTTTTTTTAAPVVTAPGMNPPHGQEGHRCEVAVGAPLPKA